jgi:molecular chaperone DnaK (HSP70)
MENVYIRSGICDQTFPLTGQIRPNRPLDQVSPFGVLIYWERTLSWLRLFAVGDAGGSSSTNIPFQDTAAGLERICQSHGVSRDQVAPSKFLTAHHLLASSLPQMNRVFLTVEIDTDDENFGNFVRESRSSDNNEVTLHLSLLFFDGKQFGRYVDQKGELLLVLKPCTPLPRYEGVLTIDLGNTTTTAVTQELYDQSYRTSSLRSVPLEEGRGGTSEAQPLVSALRIDRIISFGAKIEGQRRFPSLPTDEKPTAVRFVAGERVLINLTANDAGVVLGAKQLLSMQPSFSPTSGGACDPLQILQEEPTFSLLTEHERSPEMVQRERIEMSHRIPGELLFSHVYQRFRRTSKGWPDDVVLTYPTTYSPRELLQLQKAAVLGWLRAMGLPQSDQNVGMDAIEDSALQELGVRLRQWLQNPEGNCPLIGLTLDEATAAAFYYLYRRVFDLHGGLVRFRYLYPNGIHMLLVDVGGGTTDIALVRATSPAQEPHNLYVEILNRSGLRRFGGDSMTREICRLLKAKLQGLISRARQLPNTPPPLPGQLSPGQARQMVETYIKKLRDTDPKDILVPTMFDPEKTDEESLQRRSCFHSLWRLAEEIKRHLSNKENRSGTVRLRDLNPALLRADTSPLIASILKSIPPQQNQIKTNLHKQIEEIVITKAEVDALLREPFEKLVRQCNRLIMHHLDKNLESGVGIDWVVLSGNGSLYPLCRETLEEKLCVPFVQKKLYCEEKDLKYAVAKGATLARMVERVPRTLQIRFNSRLCELLPFDVGYHDLRTGRHNVLFPAMSSYRQLESQTREVDLRSMQTGAVDADPSQQLERVFVLERRFPGDEENNWEPYLSYEFKEALSGQIEIGYVSAEGYFRVTDKQTGVVGNMRVMTTEDSRPVAIGGDI